jgi:hypothetical protein
MNLYYRVCSTIHYFFERKLSLKDHGIYSILFITHCFVIYSFGIYYFVEIIAGKKINLNPWYFYAIYFIVTAINFFIVYKREKHTNYEKLLKPYVVIAIILIGYILMGIGGQITRDMFANHWCVIFFYSSIGAAVYEGLTNAPPDPLVYDDARYVKILMNDKMGSDGPVSIPKAQTV